MASPLPRSCSSGVCSNYRRGSIFSAGISLLQTIKMEESVDKAHVDSGKTIHEGLSGSSYGLTTTQPAKLVGSGGFKNRYFDFEKLAEITAVVTTNLNKIIDVNYYYPVETGKKSNMTHRPISIGVQGLADTFILLGMTFDSPETQQLKISTVSLLARNSD